MNGPGDIPLTNTTLSSTSDTRSCSLVSIIPNLGMSSCRGRAEAFARSLSSKLRTLGSQTDDDEVLSPEDERPIINGNSGGGNTTNTWLKSNESEHTVTDLQPLRHESDSFFDFDCDLESPGSPVDECEYLRLIETASNTPHNSAAESGYVCASAASSQSDGPYFDVINSESSGEGITTDADTDMKIMKNGPTEVRLTNGFTGDNEMEIGKKEEQQAKQVDENKNSKEEISNERITAIDIRDNVQSNYTSKALPLPPLTTITTATVESAVAESQEMAVEEPKEPDHELSTKEMVRMQDQIIDELQKKSEEYKQNERSTSEDMEAIVITQTTTVTEETTHETLHKFSNGHAQNGEETLKIEVTETDSECLQATQTNEVEIEIKTKAETDATTSPLALTYCIESVEPKKEEEEEVKTELESPQKTNETSGSASSALDNTDDDDDDCRPQRVRRCSSLKTGKTPPGTPGRKKFVRFADVLGLDLADVKTFLDEIPTIPKSAFEDLEFMESEPPMQMGPKSDKLLMPLFQQPGGLPTFLDLVRQKQVSLENAAVSDPINQTITGSVRVCNLDFHKSVHIRYTLDGWRSYADLQANYVENSCDGFSDKFTFVLFGNSLHIGQRLELAVRFQCKGQQFWDNNYGTNYCFQCLPTSTPTIHNAPAQPVLPSHHGNSMIGIMNPLASEAWCTSFY